jgi:phage tail-like protein
MSINARYTDSTKRDPYRNFNFQISINGIPVAACKKMSKLAASVDVVKFRAGNTPWATTEMSPGRVSYEPVTLESGLTQDKSFQDWALTLMRNQEPVTERKLEPFFRKDVTIDVYDIDHTTVVRSFKLLQAWVSKYTAMSDLVGDANDVIIESIQIEHEGFVSLPVAVS